MSPLVPILNEMKKVKIKYLLFLWIGLLPYYGFSQSAGAEMTQNQKLEMAFEGTFIAPTQLDAFELRGIQKLNDLASYLDYIADPKMEPAFREQAQQLALELFPNEGIPFYYYENSNKIKSTIGAYLTQLGQTKETKRTFEFIDITKLGEAEQLEGQHFWTVRFLQKEKKAADESLRTIVILKISLQKIEKKFGKKTKKIWKVFLDEMISLELAP